MKFVFFGTPRFATIIVGGLINQGFSPSAVVTNPDRPAGRKKIITPPPVKIICRKLNPHRPYSSPKKLMIIFLISYVNTMLIFFLSPLMAKSYLNHSLASPATEQLASILLFCQNFAEQHQFNRQF